ncbi:MAG: hypothetical protein SO128_08300 [Clostridium cadaveris]|uniref:Uncharacterized protein n=2 Tax=Clostridium cadaveris TaxID=1529 RepID=A0A1I2P7G4_9CLOT|nr:hypothetical protein [Clostridium cadaveris]MDM8312359.1 hypothetical protein [Clostridium cadaveris]MDY4949361.1 hypothetical protein [Clostridium cadaveris]NME64784.1 hypothetical protein [Clostridium cadaveris]NWK12339.1 hypothetical protein [Clostridium cadaveris]PWL54004.1 MAG: hypothetical protein DBY38_06300 [Clostridium cadaveris]
MKEFRIKAIIWGCLFIFSMLFSELGISYIWILVLLGFLASRSENFRECRTSFVAIGVFAIILVIALPLTISNKELDTISISVSNIEEHGNNIYIKTKEILDKGEITSEELAYINKEKDEISQWCAVFDRQSDIIGLGNVIILQGDNARNVFANQDEDIFNIEQRIRKLDKSELIDVERQWLQDVRSRIHDILMSKIIQEGYGEYYNFSKWRVRYLYLDLYKIIHSDK